MTILVSACLVGLPTRYDGRVEVNEELLRLLAGWAWVPVCPEQLGGLPTPRPPATIVTPDRSEPADGAEVLSGRAVILADGDRSQEFVKGARATLELAGLVKAETALLRKHSPSCGCREGTGSDGSPRPRGVTAALLEKQGLRLFEVDSQGVEPMLAEYLRSVRE